MPDFHRIAQDFILRYEGTYIQYRSKPTLPFETVFVRDVIEHPRESITIQLQSYRSGALDVTYAGEGEFNFAFPEVGYFQHGRNSYLGFKRPARQNKRALHVDNWTMANFYTTIGIAAHLKLDLAKVDAMFNPRYPSFNEILETLNSQKAYLQALDKTYAIGLHVRDSSNHILFADLAPIAELSKSGQITNIYRPEFERLVADAPI